MDKIEKYIQELFKAYTEFKKMGEWEIVKYDFIDDKLEVSYQKLGTPKEKEYLAFSIFIPNSFINTYNTTHKL